VKNDRLFRRIPLLSASLILLLFLASCGFSGGPVPEDTLLLPSSEVLPEPTAEQPIPANQSLNAVFEPVGHQAFRVTWDETQGEYYEIRQVDARGDLQILCRIPKDAQRCYSSAYLKNCQVYYFQVVAVEGQTEETKICVAESDMFRLETDVSALGAAVWPLRDLKAYYDPGCSVQVATAEAGKAYCVADERNGLFGVRIGDQICYIDSDYCMINLPDYLGDLCSYEIANGTGSRFTVHEFGIENVTGTVLPGYESVFRADGEYLVPLLYPAAKKLLLAARDAAERGYRLKICDAFRPRETTKELYSRTGAILSGRVPGETYTGVPIEDLDLRKAKGNGMPSYRFVMTDGRYALTSFLARGTSRHNLGVALDLTLEDLDTGEELDMQTSMHDLSWYSVTGRNNQNAEMLATVMKNAGFSGLSTEWWHFQDDEAHKTLSLRPLEEGVSPEGWVWDGIGWRYRDSSGAFVCGGTARIDEAEYSFDEAGYQLGLQGGFG